MLRVTLVNSERPYVEYKKLITNKNVGSYFMGTGKGFHIHLENKPNWLHRKCMKLFSMSRLLVICGSFILSANF